MKKKLLPFKIALLLGLSLLLTVTQYGYAQNRGGLQPGAEGTATVSLTDTTYSAFGSYSESLAALSDWFMKEGYEIDPLFRDPRFEIYETIDERFRRSAEVKSMDLNEYKRILDFEKKTHAIGRFMATHKMSLERAEETYDIPKEVIAAIIGIESNFGEILGDYNPFNTYVSMYAVGYRGTFARAQLKELLEFTEKKQMDVFELKSSYAGAMSFAQFIPYSLNKWFVGDDIFDIDNNILSVANYLAYFKKRTGSIESAVLRYNPSDLYVNAVMDLAEQATK